jgi:uroporphyrinogen-III synthase
MRIILTRPAADSEALARKLSKRGHTVLRAPLLTIAPRPKVELPDRAYQCAVFSSGNAANAARQHLERIALLPAYAVGEQSAAAARRMGFREVHAAGGSAVALADVLIDRLKPSDGPILYLSGAEVAGDLAGRLANVGFSVERVVLYDAVAAKRLPEAVMKALQDGKGSGVLLYSPRTATIWRGLIAAARLAPGPLIHYCLSANVAAALGNSYKIRIAERPSEASLLACLPTDGGP